MSEISKLYENAGVEKQGSCPPFTPKKQLELIKWLAVNKGISIQYYDDRYFAWGMSADFAGGHYFDKFEVTLADLINELWHSLTQEEKKQIKEILK